MQDREAIIDSRSVEWTPDRAPLGYVVYGSHVLPVWKGLVVPPCEGFGEAAVRAWREMVAQVYGCEWADLVWDREVQGFRLPAGPPARITAEMKRSGFAEKTQMDLTKAGKNTNLKEK